MEEVHRMFGQWFWLLALMGTWVVALAMMGAHGVFFAEKNIEEDPSTPEAAH